MTLFFFLINVLFIGFALVMLWFYRKHRLKQPHRVKGWQPPEQRKPLNPMEKTQCIAEFQNRRLRFFIMGFTPLAITWSVGSISFYFFNTASKPYQTLLFILMTLAVLNWLLVIYTIYKCPRCGAVPKNRSDNEGGITLNPSECPACGAPFK